MCNVNEDNLQIQSKRNGQHTGRIKIYGTSFFSWFSSVNCLNVYKRTSLHTLFIVEMYMLCWNVYVKNFIKLFILLYIKLCL
jgi:hypothetical protein